MFSLLNLNLLEELVFENFSRLIINQEPQQYLL